MLPEPMMMNDRTLRIATVLAAIVGWAVVSMPAHAGKQTPTYFTSAQAGAGARVYGAYCATCHGVDLRGPQLPLKGPAFVGLGRDTGMTLGRFFDFVVRDTPAGSLHSLSHAQYVAIMAYIMQQNGYAAGVTPLNFERALHLKVRIDDPRAVR